MGRTLIDGWMRVARWPADRATGLLPGADDGPRATVTQLLDRADAAVRGLAGAVLRDPELQADARRRRIAADERDRAVSLRAEATEAATAVERRTQARKASVAKRADQQERAVEQAAAAAKETAAARAKRERLEVLEERAAALDVEDEALTAADEAQRLEVAAAATKAARKQRAG